VVGPILLALDSEILAARNLVLCLESRPLPGISSSGEKPPLPLPQRRNDSIARLLRDQILRGEYSAGDRLPAERDLASRLEANRASVREALQQLEQQGLVEIRRGGGTRVRHVHEASVDIVRDLVFVEGRVDASMALQVIDVHEMLFAGAARLALERATDAELEQARALLQRFGAESLSDAERSEAADEIYELITRASGNLVLRLVRNALGSLQRVGPALLPPPGELRPRLEAIERGIAARDPVATEEAVRALLRQRRARLIALIQTANDEPRQEQLENSDEH